MASKRARILMLLAVAGLALGLRLAWLSSSSLWWDEFVTLGRAKLDIFQIWQSLTYQGPSDVSLDSSPPLLHFLVHAVLTLGPASSEVWVKSVSVACGVGTVILLYPLGTRLFSGMSGLFASAMLALSLFHIHYSREARPYSLYLFLAISSMILLLRALEKGRTRDWLYYVLAGAAMMYSSYLASACLAAQIGYVILLALGQRLSPGRLEAAGLSLAAVILAYAPWLPGHVFQMGLIYDPAANMGLSLEFLASSLKEFTAQYHQGSHVFTGLSLAVSLLGLAAGLGRNRRGAALLLLWLLLPVATVMLMRTGIAVNARYLINFSPGLALLAGAGLDSLVRAVSLALPPLASACLGLAAVVGLSWPSLVSLPDFYRAQHTMRDDMRQVAENKDNIDSLLFSRNRHLKIYANWYLGDIFRYFKDSRDLAYHRTFVLAEEDDVPKGLGPAAVMGDLRVIKAGILNLSPQILTGPYACPFDGLAFYEQAAFWRNTAPDLFRKALGLYDSQSPGLAVWRFAAPKGGFPQRVTLRLTVRLTKSRATPPPDATLTVLAGSSQQSLTPLRTVSQADFLGPDGRYRESLDLALDLPEPGGPELAVGLGFNPGTIHGELEVASFALDVPKAPVDEDIPAELLAHAAGRAGLAPWRPGLVRLGDRDLYAFCPRTTLSQPLKDLGVQDRAALATFRQTYPDLTPVTQIFGPDNSIAVEVYDPALAFPDMALPSTTDVLFAGGSDAVVAGLVLRGDLARPRLTLGGREVDVPIEAPVGSRLCVYPGGAARLSFEPDFSQGPDSGFLSFNTTHAAGQPYVACSGEDGCFLVYRLAWAQGIRAVRVEYCPQAYGEPGRVCGLNLEISSDGDNYENMDRFSAHNTELWEGKTRRVFWKRFAKPVDRVYVRFALSGDLVRLWASPEAPLRLDAWLDSGVGLPLGLGENPFRPGLLSPVHGRLGLFISPQAPVNVDKLLTEH